MEISLENLYMILGLKGASRSVLGGNDADLGKKEIRVEKGYT